MYSDSAKKKYIKGLLVYSIETKLLNKNIEYTNFYRICRREVQIHISYRKIYEMSSLSDRMNKATSNKFSNQNF